MLKPLNKDQKFTVTLVGNGQCSTTSVLACLEKNCPHLEHAIEVKSIPNQLCKFKLSVGSIADLAQIMSNNGMNYHFEDDLRPEPSSFADLEKDSYINMLFNGPMYKV